MYENKEEALREIDKIIDQMGLTKTDINEHYNNTNLNNNKNKVRIRLLSENEAILKFINPYGNQANAYTWPTSNNYYINASTTASGSKSYLVSQNKYAIEYQTGIYYENYNFAVLAPSFSKITNLLNNYYSYAAGSTNHCGFLAQHSSMTRFANFSGNGYGTLFQDNYEDKPEIRCRTRFTSRNGNNGASNYSKNGFASLTLYQFYTNTSNNKSISESVVTTYKTSAANYQGMLPVFAA